LRIGPQRDIDKANWPPPKKSGLSACETDDKVFEIQRCDNCCTFKSDFGSNGVCCQPGHGQIASRRVEMKSK